jgi:AraC-like DNA-binding protein
MNAPQADYQPIRFSTAVIPERERVSAWRDFFGPRIFGADVEPMSDELFRADLTARLLPGISMVSAAVSPTRFTRSSSFLGDGHDEFGVHINSGHTRFVQRGREIHSPPGKALLVATGQTGFAEAPDQSRYFCLHFTRTSLVPLIARPDDAVPRPVTNSAALRYLLSYVRILEEEPMAGETALAEAAATHLRDLFALVVGASRDGAEIAEGRGLRAARLAAIKRLIERNPADRTLNVNAVAARHGLTPRTVQRMFEEDGMTFSDYVLDCRLTAAHRMLNDARYAHWSVSEIALDAGFGDISYFNRRFRRRFGAPPTWLRSYGN